MKTILLLASLLAFALPSCSTNTPDPTKNIRNAGLNAAGTAALKDAGKIIGNVVVSSLADAVQTDLSGGSVTTKSLLQSGAHGLWSQVTPTTFNVDFGNIVDSFSAGKAKQTALEAAKIPPGKDPSATAGAIASVISTVTGAPPAK